MGAEDAQITCTFITKLPPEFHIPETPLAVPANVTRLGLSIVINHLLGFEESRPFDFLVNGQLLRGTLQQAVLDAALSAERVLEVEYLLALLPPKSQHQALHPDWVGAVARNPAEAAGAVSGSYDGVLRTWTGEGECAASSSIHKGPITSLTALPEEQGALLVSSGKDHYLKLTAVPREPSPEGTAAPTLLAVYKGHTEAVQCTAASPEGSLLLSGSWDTTLRLWRAGAEVATAAREAGEGQAGGDPAGAGGKKRKRSSGEAVPVAPLEEESLATWPGHSQCVSAVAWPEEDRAISGSWDHSVRVWSTERGKSIDTLNVSRAVYCLAAAEERGGLVVFGGAEPTVRLWDSRAKADPSGGLKSFSSHKGWVVAVSWRPGSSLQFGTASHDRTVKLWDVRAAVPLHTVTDHTDKVLCLAWLGPNRVVSGSADCTIRFFDVPS